ncbi:hypothetical protein PQX77_016721 [Marasmius sp. AFHP31]|nr:hypothetical protein PQX77_016721 [Marasmius sp. AFHP31]
MSSAAELKRLEQTLKWTFADKSRVQGFLAKKGRSAQQWLDRMQQLIDYPNLSPEIRPAVVTAMLRLSKNSGLHPTCLSIQNVKKIGEYPIAAGGFGDVWKGTIGDSSELVCLKVVKVYLKSNLEQLTNEYLREAILWRQMKHPNVLPFHGIYRLEHTQQLCLISPWMENGNLVEFLKATKREDVHHHTLVFDVASGLAYLHSKKIVHSDLKGVNILITSEERACIADFGLSRITDSKGLRITTSATRPVGTARWLAPELLVGNGGPSKESDVYAFACVCCEIFTGLQPFPEYANEITVAFNVAQGKRPSRPEGAPELSNAIWALMNMCWATTPSFRPTASHVLEKVEEMASEAPTPLASDWSESLFTQVRENVEYRSTSPASPNGSQPGADRSFSDLPEAAPSPGMHQRTTSDPASHSFPSSPVHTLYIPSEVKTPADDNPSPSLNSDVKSISLHPHHLKDIREVHSQIESNGSLPAPVETDIEPPEVLWSPTQQIPSSYAKPTVPSSEDLNICVKDELQPAIGTIETALAYSLPVVVKKSWYSILNRDQAWEQQDRHPAQQQAQRRREDLDDTSYKLVESYPDPDPPTATALALSRSSSYGSLIPGPPSPHQEPSGSNISKRKTPDLNHHHNNSSNHSISTPPAMDLPHAQQHLPSAEQTHQTHHHQRSASTDTTATSTAALHDIENGHVGREIKEKGKDGRLSGWLSRWTSSGHDKDKDKDHGHGQRERNQSWQLVHPEEGELTRLIGSLVATSSEDWALVLDVCERASASDSNAKEAIRALRREFKYGHPQAQLSAARLWAIMLRNSTDAFISQSTSRKFLETLEELLLSSRTNPVVKQRVMDVLAAAAYASGSKKDTGFRGLWKRVKPHDMPDEGMPFDTEDSMFNPPVGGDWRFYAESLTLYQQPQPDPKHHHIGQQQQHDHQQQDQNQPPNSQHGKTGDLIPKANDDVANERSEDRGERREHDPDRDHSGGPERKDSNRERDHEPQERDKDKDRSHREHRDRDTGKGKGRERSSPKDKDRSRKRKKHRTSRKRERDASQKIIPPQEDTRRLFNECIIGKGRAFSLSQALVHTTLEEFPVDNTEGQSIIREFRSRCIASQELIAAQIPWASAGSERSRRELNAKREAEGNPVAAEEEGKTTEERLLGDLLNANEELLAALGQYEDLERVARESKVQADSSNDVGGRRERDEIERQLRQEELYLYTSRSAPMGARSPSPSLHPGGARAPSRSPSSSPPIPPSVLPRIPFPGRPNSRPSSVILGGGLTSGQHAPYNHLAPRTAPRRPRSPGLRGASPAGLVSATSFDSNAGHDYANDGA